MFHVALGEERRSRSGPQLRHAHVSHGSDLGPLAGNTGGQGSCVLVKTCASDNLTIGLAREPFCVVLGEPQVCMYTGGLLSAALR